MSPAGLKASRVPEIRAKAQEVRNPLSHVGRLHTQAGKADSFLNCLETISTEEEEAARRLKMGSSTLG